jgi:hypothetical protein
MPIVFMVDPVHWNLRRIISFIAKRDDTGGIYRTWEQGPKMRPEMFAREALVQPAHWLLWDGMAADGMQGAAAQMFTHFWGQGAFRLTGRRGAGQPREDIEWFEQSGLILADAGNGAGPVLYPRGTTPGDALNGTARPAWIDVEADGEEIRAAVLWKKRAPANANAAPASPAPEPTPSPVQAPGQEPASAANHFAASPAMPPPGVACRIWLEGIEGAQGFEGALKRFPQRGVKHGVYHQQLAERSATEEMGPRGDGWSARTIETEIKNLEQRRRDQ